MGLSSFFMGTPAKFENTPSLLPYQQDLHKQKVGVAGQALPQLSQYYGGLMSDNSADFDAMAAPEMRRFNEQIVPGLAEQFAGMGSGGLSSSGFRNAAVSAGTDLSERLGALRAQLRQSGAAGLQGLAGMGTEQVSQSQMTDPGTQGFLSTISPTIGAVAGAYGGPPAMAAAKNWLSSNNQQSPVANQGPSAKPMGSAPNIPNTNIPSFQAPQFQTSMRRP